MHRQWLLRLFAPLLFLTGFLVLCGGEALRAPVSGRDIDSTLVRTRVGQVRAGELSERVFELDASGKWLLSATQRFDLSALTKVTFPGLGAPTQHVLNGAPIDVTPSAVLRSDHRRGLTAVYYDGVLVHFWGPDLNIGPLHESLPGIFVASRLPAGPPEPNYPMDDVPDDVSSTATPPPNPTDSSNSCARGVPHYLEVAIAYDNSLCRFYNYDVHKTVSMLHALFSAASRPFLISTCVRVAVVYIDGHCKDPQDPYSGLQKLSDIPLALEFISIWRQPKYQLVKRDVVYLITGFNDGTTSTGFAIPGVQGGVCSLADSFGWVEGIIPGVLAHNIGHTVGASHIQEGLMFPFYRPGPVPLLAPQSVAEITAFVDNRALAGCLSTQKPKAPLIPIVTEVPRPTTLPEYGTCAVSRRRENVLSCTNKLVVGRIRSSKGAGTLVVKSWQEFGQFRVYVRGLTSGIRIEKFRGLQHLNGTFTAQQVAFQSDFVPTAAVGLRRNDVNIRWPRPKLTCCDQILYIFINVHWCRGLGAAKKCDQRFSRFSRRIPCNSPCYGKTGDVLPMSQKRRCPSCAIRS